MKIIDYDEKYKDLFFTCLTADNMRYKDSGNLKEHWYDVMKKRGLKVKIVLDDNGNAGGMIQYIPSEESFVSGKNLYYLNCIWILNDKKGRGNFRKLGMGKALLKAFEEDAVNNGKDGVVVWGLSIPVFIPAKWFRKNGYVILEKDSVMRLLWKKINDKAETPSWIKPKKKPDLIPGKVNVTYFKNGWCPEINKAYERTKQAVREIGGNIIFNEIDTLNRKNYLEWGMSDALYINQKEIKLGPAPAYNKIKKAILKELKKIK